MTETAPTQATPETPPLPSVGTWDAVRSKKDAPPHVRSKKFWVEGIVLIVAPLLSAFLGLLAIGYGIYNYRRIRALERDLPADAAHGAALRTKLKQARIMTLVGIGLGVLAVLAGGTSSGGGLLDVGGPDKGCTYAEDGSSVCWGLDA